MSSCITLNAVDGSGHIVKACLSASVYDYIYAAPVGDMVDFRIGFVFQCAAPDGDTAITSVDSMVMYVSKDSDGVGLDKQRIDFYSSATSNGTSQGLRLNKIAEGEPDYLDWRWEWAAKTFNYALIAGQFISGTIPVGDILMELLGWGISWYPQGEDQINASRLGTTAESYWWNPHGFPLNEQIL